MDNFISLSNRLLSRCPSVGIILSQQLVNDAWRTMQSMREWSFRRRHATFAPPTLYQAGTVSTNVSNTNPTLISGVGMNWTSDMVGRQIRIGGLLYPFYTIIGVASATSLWIDQPWSGPDVVDQPYTISQIYYPVPEDFNYFYALVSIKDGFRLWTNLDESDLALLDPQRTNFGQTYAAAFYDYSPNYAGEVGPIIALNTADITFNQLPVSTTATGFTYPVNATYLIQLSGDGGSWSWGRISDGQPPANPGGPTDTDQAQDIEFGVQIYFPQDRSYDGNAQYIINCTAATSAGVPRYELWPGPTFNGYLYPYIYIAKESDLTVDRPQLPPFIANRGEVLLEMALAKCAEYPGPDSLHPNPYYNLKQAQWHLTKAQDMLDTLMRNDEEVGVSLVDYQMWPMYPAPWYTGQWQQSHSPYLE